MIEWDKKRLEELLNKRKEREERVEQILEEPDKRIIRKAKKRKLKRYNLSQAAKVLNVPRQSLYYWIKKGWIKPKRDYRKYPVFTEEDVRKIKEWRDKLEEV